MNLHLAGAFVLLRTAAPGDGALALEKKRDMLMMPNTADYNAS
jgi:hypothetical protein